MGANGGGGGGGGEGSWARKVRVIAIDCH
jgi:hypothetical protein